MSLYDAPSYTAVLQTTHLFLRYILFIDISFWLQTCSYLLSLTYITCCLYIYVFLIINFLSISLSFFFNLPNVVFFKWSSYFFRHTWCRFLSIAHLILKYYLYQITIILIHININRSRKYAVISNYLHFNEGKPYKSHYFTFMQCNRFLYQR